MRADLPFFLRKCTAGAPLPSVSEDDLNELKNYLIRTKPADLFEKESNDLHVVIQKVPSLVVDSSNFVDGPNNFKVVSCEILSLWFLRSTQLMSLSSTLSNELSLVFSSDKANFLYGYILDFWNESGAALGNLLKELFVKMVTFINKSYEDKNLSQSLYQGWLLQILEMSPNMKVVYFMVENLSKEIDNPYFVLDNKPSFPQTAIELMWSNALAFPVGKALYAMYRNVLTKESQNSDDAYLQWLNLWKDLVIDGLKNQNTRRNIETCLLPHMFKISSNACRLFIKQIGETDTSILLGCVRIAQNLAIIEEPFEDGSSDESTVISFEKICHLILQQEKEEFRIDAFKILVSSAKGSQPVKQYVFDAVYSLLDVLFLEDNVGTRYELFASLKQFITRSRDAAYALDRDAKKMMKKDSVKFASEIEDKSKRVSKTQDFFRDLLDYSLKSLRPGASYQRITSAQRLLIDLIRSGLDSRVSTKFHDKHHIDHPYSIPIYEKKLVRLLIDNIDNDYEDIRQSSTLILSMAPMDLEELIGGSQVLKDCIDRALEMMNDMKGRKADSGARFFQFIFTSFQSSNKIDQCWEILQLLANKIKQGTDYASKDLASAVYKENVHGYYASVKFIFQVLEFKKFDQLKITDYVNQLIEYALVSWETVKEALQHHSPEGNLPEEIEVVYTSDLETKYGKGTQVVASYSWRTLKESTSFFMVIFGKRTPEYILSDQLMIVLGDVILTQLSTVRHRGALSSVYPTFIACCERCISSSNPETQKLPSIWLEENIELLQTRSSKHITRRSAGIPYFITAILVANKGKHQKGNNNDGTNSLMQKTISELLKIAYKPVDISASEEDINLPQVNGFNCIKAIFTESLLSDESIDFISDALELSLNNFGSSVWAIRNSALMLFTALQNKLFGNKKTTNNQLLPTISARLFFTRFKKVRGILLANLKNAIDNENGLDANNENIQRVFPILTILSRLDDTSVDFRELEEFENLIYVCLESKYWKVREMTARTLPCLISNDQMHDTCIRLLENVVQSSNHNENSNHGNMLAIKELISSKKSFPKSDKLFNFITSQAATILFGRYTYSVKLAFLQTLSVIFLQKYALVDMSDCINVLGNWFIQTNGLELRNPDGSHQLASKECSRILLEYYYTVAIDYETLKDLSELCFISSHFEVIISAIDFYKANINDIFEEEPHNELKDMLFQSLWNLCSQDYWSFIKSNALTLLRDLLTLPNSQWCVPWSEKELIESNYMLESLANDGQFEELEIGAVEVSASFVSRLLSSTDKTINKEKMFNKWVVKVTELSRDNNPVNVRTAALNSLESFQKVLNSNKSSDLSSLQFSAIVYALIFNFLFDDSNELRKHASSIICRQLLKYNDESSDVLPFATVKRFMDAFLVKFQKQIVFDVVFKEDVFGFQRDFKTEFGDFKSLFIEDSLLFTIEKQNFYVNGIDRYSIFIDFITKISDQFTTQEFSEFSLSCESNLKLIISTIKDQPVDGQLGWCNDKIFTAISCVVLASKFVLSKADHKGISSLLKELELVMNQKQMHPLLEF